MLSHSRNFLPSYNFEAALRLTAEERFRVSIERTLKIHSQHNYVELTFLPPIPPLGASQQEIERLESQIGVSLPFEYSQFLQQWRYLDIYDGVNIWGLDFDNVSLGLPWMSEQHRTPYKYLVFGDYWNYADGDSVMFDLNEPDMPVVAFLHDSGSNGSLIEYFAPSFSLALWRMVDERYREA